MDQFLMGAMAMATFIVALFFLRFYRETHDRLFLIFSLAFTLLGITRVGLAMSIAVSQIADNEHQVIYYLIRLAAFVLILVAIIDKNRPRKTA